MNIEKLAFIDALKLFINVIETYLSVSNFEYFVKINRKISENSPYNYNFTNTFV